MASSWQSRSKSLNKDVQNQSKQSRSRNISQADDLSEISVLAEHLGWNYNAVLTGVYFKMHADIWKATLKVEMSSGPKVSYFTGTSLLQLVETVHWYASKGLVSWGHDKMPVRVSRRRFRPATPKRS